MTNTKDALEQARRDAQTLHKKAHNATAVRHADIRFHVEDVAEQARQLRDSLKELAESQRADAKQHLKNAAAALDDASTGAKVVKVANEDDLARVNARLRSGTATALRQLSQAVAAKRKSLATRASQPA